MTDPVAEAAAQIAAKESPSLIDEIKEGMHELAEKVEHILHPEVGTTETGETAAAPVEAAPVGTSATTSASTAESGETPGAGDLPNAASGAAEPTAAPASASNADGASTTLPTAASSAEPPLHVRIAAHLEAIYSLAKEHVEGAHPAAAADTASLKTHVGDILHRISNGMQVSSGEIVSKLEKLYQML